LSPGDEDSGSSALHGVGTDRDATGGLGLSSPRAAIRGSAALVATGLAFDSASDEKPDDLPRPGSADLLANALPFASGSLARAIDRLFQQFESVNAGEPVWQRPLRLALYSAVMACTFAAMDAVRRWRGRGMAPADLGAHDREAIANHSGFPELPGSWSSRLS
jgi:hypothetical protein